MQISKGHISAKHVCLEIIFVSGFLVAQAHSICHCFGSGIWACHYWSKAQWTAVNTQKPRFFLISYGWKIYSCCNSNISTEDNNITENNMCKFLYFTEEFALLRVIAAILSSKDTCCTGQAQMSWISGDVSCGFIDRFNVKEEFAFDPARCISWEGQFLLFQSLIYAK